MHVYPLVVAPGRPAAGIAVQLRWADIFAAYRATQSSSAAAAAPLPPMPPVVAVAQQ